MGELRVSGDDGGGGARCAICHALAAGPCASCHRPVCGDCCTLTEGGVRTFAICITCEKHGGRALRGWGQVLLWIAVPLIALVGLVVLLRLL